MPTGVSQFTNSWPKNHQYGVHSVSLRVPPYTPILPILPICLTIKFGRLSIRQLPSYATLEHFFFPFFGSSFTKHRHKRKQIQIILVIQQTFTPGSLENGTVGKVEVVRWNPIRNTLRIQYMLTLGHIIPPLWDLSFLICKVKGPSKPHCMVYKFDHSSKLLWSSHLGLVLLSASS